MRFGGSWQPLLPNKHIARTEAVRRNNYRVFVYFYNRLRVRNLLLFYNYGGGLPFSCEASAGGGGAPRSVAADGGPPRGG